ncbi:MAG TPA: RIP metalloprotease RseP [Acidimicrobiales bacterium]
MTDTIPPGSPMPPDGELPRSEGAGDREPTALDRLAESPVLRGAIVLLALGYAAYVSIWLFAVIVVIALTLFVHELGHFLVAKRNGMLVTEFFLGFGPRIWSFQRGETEYGLKVIPAGAYVKIIGMSNLEEVAPEDEARSYRAQSYWKRMPVVLAGPVVNIVVGLLLLFVVDATSGMVQASTTVSNVSPGSGAAAAGLQTGDELLSIDGVEIDSFDDVRSMIESKGGEQVQVDLVRDGSQMVVPVTVGWGVSDDVARQFGLRRGDRITQVGDTEVASYPEAVTALAQAEGPVRLVVATGFGEGEMRIEGPVDLSADGSVGLLGLAPTDSTVVHGNVLEAGGQALSDIGGMVSKTGEVLGRLFSPSGLADYAGKVVNGGDDHPPAVIIEPLQPIGEIAGASAPEGFSTTSSQDIDEDRPSSILGIVDAMTQMGERAGWVGVLAALGMVNIILGLFNLVPLLPFDGGHIAVATYEGIRGRIAHRPYRIDMAKLLPVTYAVLIFFVVFGLTAMYLDVVDPQKL